jgi:hypothetical protein
LAGFGPNGAMLMPIRLVNPANGEAVYGLGRIDTGADLALLDPRLATAIGAPDFGSGRVEGIDGTPLTDPLYQIDLDLSASGFIPEVTWIGQPLSAQFGFDALLGCNVLDEGVLVRDGPGGSFSFIVTAYPAPPPAQLPVVTVLAVGAMLIGLGLVAWGLTAKAS